MGDAQAAPSARAIAKGLAAPFAVGALLRLWNLPAQVLGDDQMHAVRAALAMPVSEILVTYRATDHCIPLTALYRLAMDAGVPLSEIHLRAPVLIAGLLLLATPALFAARLGLRAMTCWAWALALAPMLVLYSGIVRSYMPIALLGVLLADRFERWWQAGAVRDALAYVALAVLAVWFHLGAAPFAVAPLAFGAMAWAWQRRKGGAARSLASLAALAAGVGAGLMLFMLPAWESLSVLIERKRVDSAAGLGDWLEVAQLHAGVRWPALLAVGVWALGATGLVALARRAPRFAAYTACLVVAQAVGLLVLSPKLSSPALLNRALLITLPWTLLWLAAGVAVLSARFAPHLRTPLAVAAFALLFAAGPLAQRDFWTTSFRHHDGFLLFSRPRVSLPSEEVPGWLAALDDAGEGAVIELPWHPFWGFNHSAYAYQAIHRRPVMVSNAEAFAGDPRLAWRNFVPFEPDRLLASGARYVVVHSDPGREELRAQRSVPGAPVARPQPRTWATLRAAASSARQRLGAAFGPPVYVDDEVQIWDLSTLAGPAQDDATRR